MINYGRDTMNKLSKRDSFLELANRFFNDDEFGFTPFSTLRKNFYNTIPEFKQLDLNCDFGAYPRANCYEYTDRLELITDIPGLKKDQVEVTVEGNVLQISGEKREQTVTDAVCILKEMKHSAFTRSFKLNADKYNLDKIDATFEDGTLNIVIPRCEPVEEEKPHRRFINLK